MAIFKVTKERAIQSDRADFFQNEFELRDFFARNLEELLGVKFLDKEHQIPEGRIDTLGIDEDGSPVIIEYKWNEDDGMLTQGQFYYSWLLENKKHFELLVESKSDERIDINWDRPRVVLIAQGFSRRIRGAVKHIDYIELVAYSFYKPDILYLEGVDTSPSKISSSSVNEEEARVYDKNYHFSLINSDKVKEKVELLRKQIIELPDVQEILGQKTGISYKTTKKFVRFSSGATHVMILLKNPTYSRDEKKIVEDITKHGWGYDGKIKFTAESDVGYVFEIIKEAYEQTQ